MRALLALPFLAACAAADGASDGSAALPSVEKRCAAYAVALNINASVAEIDAATRNRASAIIGFATIAGCSGPEWVAAYEAWADAVAR